MTETVPANLAPAAGSEPRCSEQHKQSQLGPTGPGSTRKNRNHNDIQVAIKRNLTCYDDDIWGRNEDSCKFTAEIVATCADKWQFGTQSVLL